MTYDIVTADYVLANLGKMPLVDVRPGFMYADGRIPGAISIELIAAKEANENTADLFARKFEEAHLTPDVSFIVYCHNGGLAKEACDLLASKGYTHQHCYEGSWVDWISDSSRPIER